MSSNNNQQTNEYLSNIIAQLLQQQQQADGAIQGGQGSVVRPPQNNALQNIQQQQMPADQGRINHLLTGLLQQQGVAGLAALTRPQPQAAAPFAPVNAYVPQAGSTDDSQVQPQAASLSQSIISSMERLASINPNLAAAAVKAMQQGQGGARQCVGQVSSILGLFVYTPNNDV